MISVDEALRLVCEQARPLAPRAMPLRHALDCVLAEEVTSDVDSPPHDKSIVDGYAVIAADLAAGQAELALLEEVVAGALPQQQVRAGTTTRVMTGAPIPTGADAVVMIERCQPRGANVLVGERATSGQNIVRRAASIRAGDTVLRSGTRLSPPRIGLLAEVGRAELKVYPPPRVAILPTGNELVDFSHAPGPSQIRNSNGPLLSAAVQRAGGQADELPIARDDPRELRQRIVDGLQADVLLLTGGVSAGVLDLVPGILVELGARQIFHKVRVKPGKPLWFGVFAANDRQTLIFGLPGNPVSTYVSFELFVHPAMRILQGLAAPRRRSIPARLATEFRQRGDRDSYLPAILERDENGSTQVELPRWQGSGDLFGLAAANALAIFPACERVFAVGETIDVLPLDTSLL